MPTYEYQCSNCKTCLEKLQKITDEPLLDCPSCSKQTLQRRPGRGIGLSFIGSGFYANDYGTKKSDTTPESGKSSSGACCPCGKNKPSCNNS